VVSLVYTQVILQIIYTPLVGAPLMTAIAIHRCPTSRVDQSGSLAG
jgi:hypothetical protein